MSQSFDSNFTVAHPREIIMNSAKAFMFCEATWLVSRWFYYFYFSREVSLYRVKTFSSASLRSANTQNTKEGGTELYIDLKI